MPKPSERNRVPTRDCSFTLVEVAVMRSLTACKNPPDVHLFQHVKTNVFFTSKFIPAINNQHHQNAVFFKKVCYFAEKCQIFLHFDSLNGGLTDITSHTKPQRRQVFLELLAWARKKSNIFLLAHPRSWGYLQNGINFFLKIFPFCFVNSKNVFTFVHSSKFMNYGM